MHNQLRHLYEDRGGTRYAIERLDAAFYLQSTYYQRWLKRMEIALLESGTVTAEELEAKTELYRQNPDQPVLRREDPDAAAKALNRLHAVASAPRDRTDDGRMRYKIGDRVRARNINPPGHVRMPRYIRGREGVIVEAYGLRRGQPDTDAAGKLLTQGLQHLYRVCFSASELWGDEAEKRQNLYIDMWDSYLE
jgi:nitrile hydratase